MAEPDPEMAPDGAPQSSVGRLIARVRAHPVVAVAVAIVGVGTFAISVENVVVWTRERAQEIANPNAAEYEALETLDLDTRLEFFEANFGTAKSVYDLCEEALLCPEGEQSPPVMYLHETDDLAVRAAFEGEQLQMYAVTLRSDALAPEMQWLDWPLGRLGEVSFAEALNNVETVAEPTDLEIFMGPQAVAYAEVVAAGAPAQYRGLVLAHAPDGYSGPGTSFDTDAGFQLAESQGAGAPDDPEVAERFRSGTTPNTFGEFRDDGGTVGSHMNEAQQVIPLLFVGTEF